MEPNFDFNMYHVLALGLIAFVYFNFDANAYMERVTKWLRKE